MRITNNVIMRNTKNNINTNKVNVNNMNNQMSSQKKIDKPSDDPVIAVRSLRLRSNLSELDQYLKTNIKEATSWLEITDTAITNMKTLLNDMHTLADHGANDTLDADDRNTLLAQLKQNQEQIYAEGNADYAGRTVFTGWKTDTSLTFQQDRENEHYTINERFTFNDINEKTYVYNELTNDNIVNFRTSASAISNLSNAPGSETLNRIRLAYGNIDLGTDIESGANANGQYGTLPQAIDYTATKSDGTTEIKTLQYATITTKQLEEANYDLTKVKNADGTAMTYDVTEEDGSGGTTTTTYPYECFLNTDTGELIFTNKLSDTLKKEQASFEFTYDKTGFQKGDLTPENYFDCTNWSKGTDDDPTRYTYTHYDDDGNWKEEPINYTIAANQEMKINLEAHDVFNQNLDRDISEMTDAVQAAIDAHNKLDQLEAMKLQDAYSSDDDQAKLDAMIEAANKEVDYADNAMRDLFTKYVGRFQQYKTTVELAGTDLGARGMRLSLTENRVSSQYDTVDKLKSENEDEDLSDIVIDYQAAYLAYQASLQAGAKVQQQTLLDYI